MSGGVDSSLAAAILKEKGHDIIGATMKFWPTEEYLRDDNVKACCSLKGIEDAKRIAGKLNIPHYVFDFHREFKDEVIDYFCGEYIRGFTPNPCIVCNRKIKFNLLLKKANELGCEYIATGHYAKVGYNRLRHRYFIGEGKDKEKDQSYFLSFLSQAALAKTVFPLENMTKDESRHLARDLRLKVHNKRSSQEVCFIRGHYSDYVAKQSKTNLEEGDILNRKGEKMGRHKGIHFYTIGQRKGLGIPYKEALYVTNIDRKKNAITVGTKKEAMKRIMIVKNPCWGLLADIKKEIKATCKIRYMHKKAEARVKRIGNKKLKVNFYKPQIAPTPGQAAVFYKADKILGGAWIDSVLE